MLEPLQVRKSCRVSCIRTHFDVLSTYVGVQRRPYKRRVHAVASVVLGAWFSGSTG